MNDKQRVSVAAYPIAVVTNEDVRNVQFQDQMATLQQYVTKQLPFRKYKFRIRNWKLPAWPQ